jgi:diaminopimelate epimerase
MKRLVTVHKMSGAGNTFTIFDNRNVNVSIEDIQKNAFSFANAFGEKTEGIMALNSAFSDDTDFDVWFFNPDGSFGPMCGNGSRCAVEFSRSLGIVTSEDETSFTMANAIYFAEFTENGVAVTMPNFKEFKESVSVRIGDRIYVGSYLNVGSDHFVLHKNQMRISDSDFWTYDFTEDAKQIRFAQELEPRGVNVSIFMITEDKTVLMRTYERGVEAETGACGTGAISVGYIVHSLYSINFPLKIIPTSKETIWVDYIEKNHQQCFILEGNAKFLQTMNIEL